MPYVPFWCIHHNNYQIYTNIIQHYLCLISLNGMEVVEQAWSGDKQAAFYEAFCGSTNWSWTVFQTLLENDEGNKAVGHCKWKEVTLLQRGAVDSEHTEVWWGQCPQYYTKVNCNNWEDWTQEQLQVICAIHNKVTTITPQIPDIVKIMSYTLPTHVSGRWNFCRKLPQHSEQILQG